ncbi:hypothetical protein [Dyella sp. Tek66A03]|uniref:hypothetical protein n=1 Tax=Dyella sp. Tek66A03 TaxID=3458298 RepID=UPI00403EE07F
MITLNTDKGFVRVENWEEITSRPGFTPNIDPNAVKLQSIIGSYSFADFVPCGLSTCHQPHGRGYLVVTMDGRETNIGHDCGKKYFSVDFEDMARRFDRDVRAQERREILTSTQLRLPAIEARLAQIKDGPNGGTWIYKQVQVLTERGRGLPDSVVRVTTQIARSRNPALTKQRVATQEERDRMVAAGQRLSGEAYVENVIGQLDGAAALYAENNLRELLVTKLRGHLDELAVVEVETLDDRELRRLSKWAEDIDPTLAQAEDVAAYGRKLLTRANIGQLLTYATSKQEREQVAHFLDGLLQAPERSATA